MANDTTRQQHAIRERAAQWQARMQASDCDANEREALRHWLDANPDHAIAYAQMDAIYRQSARMELNNAQRAVVDDLRARSSQHARRRVFAKRIASWGLAASLLLAAGLVWQGWNPSSPPVSYASQIGEQRAITLEDGSQLLLDTDSRVDVLYSRQRRDLVLARGRAQFVVAHAEERPFVVNVDGTAVRAIGTTFQIRLDRHGTLIRLLEGVVDVSVHTPGSPSPAWRLTAHQQASRSVDGHWTKQDFDPASAQNWTRGELVFHESPLAEVVEEMNRYTAVKLRLADPEVGSIRLSGMFYGSDQASLVAALESMWSLRAEPRNGEILIQRR